MRSFKTQDDSRILRTDIRIKDIVERMRDTQFLVDSDEKKRFGILPENFDLLDLNFSYSQLKS